MSGSGEYEVVVSAAAEADLNAIGDYLAAHFSAARAAEFAAAATQRIGALATFPLRGSVPPEARALGLTGYRQTVQGPTRFIHKVEADRVIVILVADGRRDMQVLLAARLLDDRRTAS